MDRYDITTGHAGWDARRSGVVWYMDEQEERKRKSLSGTSKQEVKEIEKRSIPAKPGQPEREDYVYTAFAKITHRRHSVITNLQMQTYVTVHSFEYAHNKYGRPYGWGIARYAVTEDVLGEDVTRGAYHRTPEESGERIFQHIKGLCPDASGNDIKKLFH